MDVTLSVALSFVILRNRDSGARKRPAWEKMLGERKEQERE